MKAETEKVTLNMNSMDLAYIDLLVEQGYYQNRTDFLKKAVSSQLETKETAISEAISQLKSRKTISIGVVYIDGEFSEAEIQPAEELVVVGFLMIDKRAAIAEMKQHYSKITVYGVVKASTEIKQAYQL
ncbi:hypothetical protein ACFQ4L_06965 [Lapidilactobacillus mulanensis]|uniref:CopG family transcriptional regulator n=1 Tax=Lapidilactobacillus mulanensis TaxID=2485999 RepID=A0ABW4DPQ6_9LACO|nr:hypothetical protein [Lapidilactobacillus mulanensis]